MSDDKDNVIEAVFTREEDEQEEYPRASEVFEILAGELEGNDEGIETIVLLYGKDAPTALMGNVPMDRAAMLLLLGQVALTDTMLGGQDETIH